MRDSENANVIYRRIGNTTYKLRVHFSGEATETMEEKILRLIRCQCKIIVGLFSFHNMEILDGRETSVCAQNTS